MRVPPEVYAAVVKGCRDIAAIVGLEACGVLAGPADRPRVVTEVHPMLNVHEHPRHRWEFDRAAQVELWCVLDLRDMRPRVIYHSHVDSDAVMSETDVRYAAADPTIAHLIVSLSERTSRLWSVSRTGGVSGRRLEVADDWGVPHPVEFQ